MVSKKPKISPQEEDRIFHSIAQQGKDLNQFHLYQKVKAQYGRYGHKGVIVGLATIGTDKRAAYVVELDNGFWSEDKHTYVSMLVLNEAALLALSE